MDLLGNVYILYHTRLFILFDTEEPQCADFSSSKYEKQTVLR